MRNIDYGRIAKDEGKNADAIKETGLEFKMGRKRTVRRPTRSKSSVSSKIYTQPQQNGQSDLIDQASATKQNQQPCINGAEGQGQLKTKQERVIENERRYADRRVKRQSRNLSNLDVNAIQLNERGHNQPFTPQDVLSKCKDKLSQFNQIYENSHQLRPCLTSKESIRTQNYYDKFRQTQPQIKQIGSENMPMGRSTVSHCRNKTQNLDERKDHGSQDYERGQQRQHNFHKNRILSRITSINEPIIQQSYRVKLRVSHFQFGLCCSEDIFGKTYPTRHIETGFVLCIKVVSKREVQFQLDRLIECLKLQCFQSRQYLVDIYGIFQQSEKIYILMEYHNQGELFLRIKSPLKMPPKEYLSYFHSICSSIGDLHSQGIVYRNFKPQNLSLFYDTCKIASLSWGCRVDLQRSHFQGAIEYCSPEVLAGCRYDKPADIWALGVLLYEIATGATPCQNLSRRQAKQRILNQHLTAGLDINSDLARLLDMMLAKDPILRPTIEQVLAEVELLDKLLSC